MRAQIVKINPKTVVLKNEKGAFATVAKTKLDFEYKLGDLVTLERNGNEVYFLPNSAPSLESMKDFWGDSAVVEDVVKGECPPDEYTNKSMNGALIALALIILGWFVAFYACAGGAVGAIIYSFSQIIDTNPRKKPMVTTLLVIDIISLIIEAMISSGNW